MSGGSNAGCVGCYEGTDNSGKTIFVKPDKSKFLAKQDDVWACFPYHRLGNIPGIGGWFVKSMYILTSYLVCYFYLILFAPSVENYVVILALKDIGGRGLIQSIGREIACHFSQDNNMVTKFLIFIHTHPI